MALPRFLLLAVGLIGLFLLAWVSWCPLSANDLGGDEGYYGAMARNILAAPARYLPSPSLIPLGPPGDKPPLHPALLALSVRLFGFSEPALRWPSLLFAGLTALAVGLILLRFTDRAVALVGMGFLLSLPAFADGARVATADTPLAAFGTLAIAAAIHRPASVGRALVAGILVGAAFLCRLWLAAIFVIPIVALLWSRRHPRPLVVFLTAAALVSATHLLIVWVARPDDLRHWIDMYRWGALGSRLRGDEFTGASSQPPTFYWFELARACGLLLPFVGAGLAVAAVRARDPAHRAVLAWFLGLVVISGFSVKSGVYAFALLPAWAVTAALGVGELRARGLGLPALGGLVFMALASPWLARAAGQRALPVLVWLAVLALAVGLAAAARRRPRFGAALVLIAAVALVALGTVRVRQRLTPRYHDVGYAAIAARLEPVLVDIDPRQIAFVSVEAPTLMAYLFRRGVYWYSPGFPWNAADRSLAEARGLPAAFVVDPRGELLGGTPDPATLAWLESRFDDVAPGLRTRAGAPTRLRVFVPRAEPD